MRDAANTAAEALTKVTGLATAVGGAAGQLGQDRRIADAYEAAAQALKAAVVAMTGSVKDAPSFMEGWCDPIERGAQSPFQAGTEGSNLAPSSGESVSAVTPWAVCE